MYKAVIIGCGKIAGAYDSGLSGQVYSHSHAYALHPDFKVVAYVDKDIDKARALATKYGSNSAYTDYIEAIEDLRPDVISVCTPDITHYQLTRNILDLRYKPKVIFLEKPACSSVEELDNLIEISEAKNVKIVVNHSRRFDTNHQAIRWLIHEGFFGDLQSAHMVYYGGWRHNGVHSIDTLHFLFGRPLRIMKYLGATPGHHPEDPTLEFKLGMDNSNAELILIGQDESHYQLFEFDFRFDRSRLRIEDFGQRIIYERKTVNVMQENVLVLEPFDPGSGDGSPMQNALAVIHRYLEVKTGLEGFLISDIKETMQIMMEGEKWQQ